MCGVLCSISLVRIVHHKSHRHHLTLMYFESSGERCSSYQLRYVNVFGLIVFMVTGSAKLQLWAAVHADNNGTKRVS